MTNWALAAIVILLFVCVSLVLSLIFVSPGRCRGDCQQGLRCCCGDKR